MFIVYLNTYRLSHKLVPNNDKAIQWEIPISAVAKAALLRPIPPINFVRADEAYQIIFFHKFSKFTPVWNGTYLFDH